MLVLIIGQMHRLPELPDGIRRGYARPERKKIRQKQCKSQSRGNPFRLPIVQPALRLLPPASSHHPSPRSLRITLMEL